MLNPLLALHRQSLLSFFWGLLTALIATPIAGFVSLIVFARAVLGRAHPSAGGTEAIAASPKTGGFKPLLIFGIIFLLSVWLLAHAWPSGLTYPWYPIGVATTCISMGLLSWWRAALRRQEKLASNRPGAIQWALNQALHEAVAHGRIPPGLHGDILVLVESDGEGNLAKLTISDQPPVPAPIKALAGELLTAVPREDSRATGHRFTLRY